MPSSGLDANYHLLRVRVKKHVFYRLQELAMEETHATGEYTTVSDLVRSAIYDWLQTHDAARRHCRCSCCTAPCRPPAPPHSIAVPWSCRPTGCQWWP